MKFIPIALIFALRDSHRSLFLSVFRGGALCLVMALVKLGEVYFSGYSPEIAVKFAINYLSHLIVPIIFFSFVLFFSYRLWLLWLFVSSNYQTDIAEYKPLDIYNKWNQKMKEIESDEKKQ